MFRMIDGRKIANTLDRARMKLEDSFTDEMKTTLLATLESKTDWVSSFSFATLQEKRHLADSLRKHSRKRSPSETAVLCYCLKVFSETFRSAENIFSEDSAANVLDVLADVSAKKYVRGLLADVL